MVKKFFLTLLLIIATIATWAYDFASEAEDGSVLYYNITSTTNFEVSVSKGNSPSNNLIIPQTVTYNNQTYSVTSIERDAFRDNADLVSVNIPNSVTSIGDNAFLDCSSLARVNIPNHVTKIGTWVFGSCKRLSSITIPNSITSIEYCAFCGCESLTSIIIPNSVVSIGSSAFSGCIGLTSLFIPKSVTDIGRSAFDRCTGLTSITVETDNPSYCTKDNVLYNKNKTELIYCIRSYTGNFVIPNSVTSIEDYAFSQCSGIISTTFGNSVKNIGKSAYNGCTGLSTINIPNSVTNIGNYAFANCSGLTSAAIGNSVTTIGEGAFWNCSNIVSVCIGTSVKSIGESAFNRCSNMREFRSYNITPPTCGNYVFYGVKTTHCKLYVPTGSKNDYAFASGWCDFTTIIEETVVDPSNEIATPIISYEDGRLVFSSITEEVEYVYSITSEDIKNSLTSCTNGYVPLTATYSITAYAKKGEKTSAPAYATLYWTDCTIDNELGVADIMANHRALFASSHDGFITISGLSDGETVEMYDFNGRRIATTIAHSTSVTLSACTEKLIIIKVGQDSIKVKI